MQIEFTPEFKRNIRRLSKKYRNIRSDVEPLIEDLKSGKSPGAQVRHTVYKTRIKNSNLKKGKRAGYRLIYYIKTLSQIILVTIYSKTEQGDISTDKVRRILKEFESSPRD